MRFLVLLIPTSLPIFCTTLSLPNGLASSPHTLHQLNITFETTTNNIGTPNTWPSQLPFSSPAPDGHTIRIDAYNPRRIKRRGYVSTIDRDLHSMYSKILTRADSYEWDGSATVLSYGIVDLYLVFEEKKAWEGAQEDVLRFLSLLMGWTARSGEAREIQEAYMVNGEGRDTAMMMLQFVFAPREGSRWLREGEGERKPK